MTILQVPFEIMRRYSRARLLVSGLMLLLLVAAALHIDWKPVLSAMTVVRPGWLAAALCFSSLAVILRGLRLALVSGSVNRFSQGWRAFSFGYAGNLILPFGFGELVKIATFRQLANISFAQAAAASLMDRILDVIGMLSVLSVFLALGAASVLSTGPLVFLYALVAVLIAALSILAWHGHSLRRWLEHKDPEKAHPRLQAWLLRFDHFHEQSLLLRTPTRLFPLLALQVFIVFMDAFAAWLSLKAFPFGVGIGLMAAFRLNLYLMVAASLPLLPGGLGMHQVACVLAMRTYHWTQAQALALSLIGQGITVLWVVLQAFAALISSPSGMMELKADTAKETR